MNELSPKESRRDGAPSPGEVVDGKMSRWITGAAVLLVLAYAIQVASPLRINTDSAEYLARALQWIDTGHPGPSRMPTSYSVLLGWLATHGVHSSGAIIALNVIGVMGAAIAAYLIGRQRFGLSATGAACCASALPLSYLSVKHVTLVMPDAIFAALALWSIALLERRPRAPWALVAALGLAVCAFLLKTLGAALLGAWLWNAIQPNPPTVSDLLPHVRRYRWKLLVSAAILAAVAAKMLGANAYVLGAFDTYRRLGALAPLRLLQFRLQELGEFAVNVPGSKLGRFGPLVLLPLGALTTAAIVADLRPRLFELRLTPTVIAVLAYAAILAVWPYWEARYLIPLTPALLGAILTALPSRRLRIAYLGIYAAMGIMALAYSTRLSFSTMPRFIDRFGDGAYRPLYRAAYLGATIPIPSADSVIVRALQLFPRHF